ncbi:MAG: hypothetical protein LBD94_01270 [Rickettsiales bacterium]|nr:hypothetical protein [Rickettsiales bacterium]
MFVISILSGVMILVSAIILFLGNKCDCNRKARRWQIVMLLIASILYVSSLAGHLINSNATDKTAEVSKCH